jgi:hypothetical protein
MYRFLIITNLWLALAFSAFGLSMEIPVTPKALDQGTYVFSVTTNAVQDGVAFHVVISTKTNDISTNCSIGVSVVTHWEPGGSEIVPANPAIPVTVKKDGRIWRADFIVSHGQLKQAGLSCVFSQYDFFIVKGRRIAAGSATFYELRLQDFL